ncbi:MAG: RNA-binding protein [Bacteroidia bacterium]|nr:RNA-binding protein [Bacteroidia bacterium]
MNIFVAKLNFDTQESDLRTAFEEFGEVDSVKIIMDKFSGRSKGFGFVEMSSDEAGQNAIDGLNDTDFDGRTIVVKKAEPRERRDNRGGGGGYNRGGGGGYNRGGGGGGYNRGGGGGGYDRRY